MNEKTSLAALIRAARMKKSLTQFELSVRLGYNYNVLASWESAGQNKLIYKHDWDALVRELGAGIDHEAAAPLVAELPDLEVLRQSKQVRQQNPDRPNAVDGVGARLKRLRKAFGLTLADVAGELQISSPQVSRIEADKTQLSLGQLQVLCKLYDTSYEFIIDGVGDMHKEKV